MDTIRAKELLSALADGMDPFTGVLFPPNHICNHPDIIRALHHILSSTRDAKKGANTPNAGKSWPQAEQDKLVDEFYSGMKLSAIAREHGRSRGAIEAKLAHLGLIENAYFGKKPK